MQIKAVTAVTGNPWKRILLLSTYIEIRKQRNKKMGSKCLATDSANSIRKEYAGEKWMQCSEKAALAYDNIVIYLVLQE